MHAIRGPTVIINYFFYTVSTYVLDIFVRKIYCAILRNHTIFIIKLNILRLKIKPHYSESALLESTSALFED